jgi:hypothetical protein
VRPAADRGSSPGSGRGMGSLGGRNRIERGRETLVLYAMEALGRLTVRGATGGELYRTR